MHAPLKSMKQTASLNVGVKDLWFIKIFQIDVK